MVDLTCDNDGNVRSENPSFVGRAGGGVNGARVPDFPAAPPGFAQPLCRVFWKAGDYDVGMGSQRTLLSILRFIV